MDQLGLAEVDRGAKSVTLDESERIVGLCDQINPHNIKPCFVVTHPRTASAAEQVD
jgi:hypothetical protein